MNLKGKARKTNGVTKLIYNIVHSKKVVMKNQVHLQLQKHKNDDVYFVAKESGQNYSVEQDSPSYKIDGGLCLHAPFSSSKDGVFIA